MGTEFLTKETLTLLSNSGDIGGLVQLCRLNHVAIREFQPHSENKVGNGGLNWEDVKLAEKYLTMPSPIYVAESRGRHWRTRT